jgi:hypothetical protein
MIENEEQLKAAVDQTSDLLQQIHYYVKANPRSESKGKMRFPRGFLRTNAEARKSFQFVENKILRSNISYAIMTHDVLRWIVTRTDLSGQAKEMVMKEGICVMASVCECLTIHPSEYGLGRGSSFAKRVAKLHSRGIIKDKTKTDLLWLWDKRRQEHLYEVEFPEYSHYTTADWNQSIRAYKGLRDGLRGWLLPDE